MAVADLIYSIAGDSSRFVRALQQADRELQRTTANMSGLAKVGAYVTAGLGAAGTALGELSRQAANDMVEIQRAADRVGMSAEQMSRLEYAAKLSGIQFDELADAVQEFNLKIGEARTGDQASIDAFQHLGVAVNDASGALRPAGDVLQDVIDALARVPDKATQSALAAKVLGEEAGIKLGPLLAKGTGALKDMGDEAQKLGLVFDDKAGASAVQFREDMARLQGVAEGLGRQLVQVFTPALTAMTNAMIDNATEVDNMKSRQEGAIVVMKLMAMTVRTLGFAFQYTGDLVSRFFSGVINEANAALVVLQNMPGALAEMAAGAPGAAMRAVASATSLINEQQKIAIENRDKIIADFEADMERIKNASATPQKKFLFVGPIQQVKPEPPKVVGGKSKAKTPAQLMAEEAERALESMRQAAERIFDQTRTAAEKAATQLAEIQAYRQAGLINEATAARAIAAVEAERDRDKIAALDAVKARADEIRKSLKSAAVLLRDGRRELLALLATGDIDKATYEGALAKLKKEFDPATKKFYALKDAAKSLREELATPAEQVTLRFQKLKELFDAGRISSQEFKKALAAMAGDEFTTDAQKTQAELDRINELLRLGAISADQYDVALNKLFTKTPAKLTEAQNFGVSAAKALQSSFADFLFDPFGQGLEGMVKGFAAAMARIVAELLAKKAVLAILGAGGASPEFLAAVGGATFAEGGYVSGPGTGTSDSIPARLSNGEYVMPAKTVSHFGVDFMDAIRAMRPARQAPVARFAEGGYVNQQASSGGGVRVVNVVDSSMVQDFLTSSAGEQVILNTIRRNRRQVSQVMG